MCAREVVCLPHIDSFHFFSATAADLDRRLENSLGPHVGPQLNEVGPTAFHQNGPIHTPFPQSSLIVFFLAIVFLKFKLLTC